jgi:hypothetical protein
MEFLRYLGIAFASSALLLVLSKIVMQFLFRRPADYYLREEYRQEELILNNAGFSISDEVETTPEGEVTEEHVHAEPQIPKVDERFLIKDLKVITNYDSNDEEQS